MHGIAATDWEQDGSRAYDLLEYFGKPGSRHIIHLPYVKRDRNVAYFTGEIKQDDWSEMRAAFRRGVRIRDKIVTPAGRGQGAGQL